MVKNFQDVGDEILDEFLVYMTEKERFEKLLVQSGADMMSDECKKLLNIRDDKLWQILRSKVYEKLREIPYC